MSGHSDITVTNSAFTNNTVGGDGGGTVYRWRWY